ncbi:MAG TPA: hypothetical protein VD993_07655 [Chitinophagaceae bacterium]|nr:hypothetical protein [Chitinophagaceae bacterium]
MTEPVKPSSDFRIAWLSLLGLGGFILGCIFLFYPDLLSVSKPNSVFHEIIYAPKSTVDKNLLEKLTTLKKEEVARQDTKKKKTLEKDKATGVKKELLEQEIAELDRLSTTAVADIKVLTAYRNTYEHTSKYDSASFVKLNKAIHFNIGMPELREWDKRLRNNKKDNSFETGYVFKDSGLSFSIPGTAKLAIQEADSDIAFITKYPGVGIWVLLVLIFCSFLTISISTSFFLRNRVHDTLDELSIDKPKKWLFEGIAVITFVCLFIMWGIGRLSFNDEDVVRGLFFMYHLKHSLFLIQILAFVAGACCLAGFIYTAAPLTSCALMVKQSQINIQPVRAELDTLKATAATKTAEDKTAADAQVDAKQQELSVQEADLKKAKALYDKLRGYFETYFVLSAVILSLLVLCTGGLYSVINNLDFVKLLADDWGYSPARSDYVYLYGGLYTVVLLLVYIPAKMRFSEISFPPDPTAPPAANAAQSGKKIPEFLKTPFGKFGDVLIAASPLLASLVQSLFEVIFN